MKKIPFLTTGLFALALALTSQLHGQITLYQYGESTGYTTFGRSLQMEDGTTDATSFDLSRSFNTVDMSPNSVNYLGPEFFGGWEATGSLNQAMDFSPQLSNDQTLAGGFDGPTFFLNNTTGTSGSFYFLMMGAAASTDLADLDAFTLGASRTTGAGNNANARAVIRIGADYYISDDTGNVTGTYGDIDLAFSSWSNYDPGTSITTIGSSATLNGTDQVDAVGFLLQRNVESTAASGNVRFGVGKFEVTAVPEPSTYALIGLVLASLVLMRRNRLV